MIHSPIYNHGFGKHEKVDLLLFWSRLRSEIFRYDQPGFEACLNGYFALLLASWSTSSPAATVSKQATVIGWPVSTKLAYVH